MGEIRGGGGKAGRWVSKMSQRENVSYDGNAAKELAVSGSIFKEDGVLSSPPLQLPSLLTTVHAHGEAHSHNPCSSTPSSSWNSRSMKWSSPSPSLPLSLSLSFSIRRFHSVFVARTLSVTVSAHSPSLGTFEK